MKSGGAHLAAKFASARKNPRNFQTFKRAARWLVRVKKYSNWGLYYVGDFNIILPVLVGGLSGLWEGIAAYFAIQVVAAFLGYGDYHYWHRIQYDTALDTQANPFLLNEIRRRKK